MSLVISKKNKVIFFHLPKNAGTSVSDLLLRNENYYYCWVIFSKIIKRATKSQTITDLFGTGTYLVVFIIGLFISLEILHLEKTVTSILAGAGVLGLVSAYRMTQLSLLAPFEYFGIPFALVLGWWFFAEAPIERLFPGVLAIVAGGLVIIWRQTKLKKDMAP